MNAVMGAGPRGPALYGILLILGPDASFVVADRYLSVKSPSIQSTEELMKKAKARARNQPSRAANKLPSRKAPSKARPRTSKSAPSLETRELVTTNGVLQLDPHLLQMNSARSIAKSIKRSADTSDGLDHSPFHSAMSVLSSLVSQIELLRMRLEAAKKELRTLYNETEEKAAGEHIAVPPLEYARKRSAPKGSRSSAGEKVSDNRPRSRPNKVV